MMSAFICKILLLFKKKDILINTTSQMVEQSSTNYRVSGFFILSDPPAQVLWSVPNM